ncbi:hypothetical protein EHM76_04065 [bacterium]|nr:MAG: hypothetical protein EHM76_04065 [bacterium]
MVEVIVRLAAPQILLQPRPDLWQPDPALGYRHTANIDTEASIQGNRVHFVTDDRGYRIDSKSPSRDCDPAVHILMLGDSMLEGMKVEEDQTIPALTAQLLERVHDVCAEIDNSGVSGWDPNHYCLEARRALDERRYRAGVVFVYVGNDVIESEANTHPPGPYHRPLRLPRSLRRGELMDAVINPIDDGLRSRSHAYVLARDRVRVQARRYNGEQNFPKIYRRDCVDAPFWSVAASVCEKIQAQFDDQGVPVLFVFVPAIYQVITRDFDRYVSDCGLDPSAVDATQPNRLLAREFATRGIRVVDPLEDMRREAEKGVDMYRGRDAHFSVEGTAFMARYILPELLGMLGNGSTRK